MEVIGLRLLDLYGLVLVLRCYLRLRDYWWFREKVQAADDDVGALCENLPAPRRTEATLNESR